MPILFTKSIGSKSQGSSLVFECGNWILLSYGLIFLFLFLLGLLLFLVLLLGIFFLVVMLGWLLFFSSFGHCDFELVLSLRHPKIELPLFFFGLFFLQGGLVVFLHLLLVLFQGLLLFFGGLWLHLLLRLLSFFDLLKWLFYGFGFAALTLFFALVVFGLLELLF